VKMFDVESRRCTRVKVNYKLGELWAQQCRRDCLKGRVGAAAKDHFVRSLLTFPKLACISDRGGRFRKIISEPVFWAPAEGYQ